MKNKGSKKKLIIIIPLCLIVLLLAGWWAFCIKMYNDNFNVRCDSYEPLMLRLEDFDGLKCSELLFPSDKGQKLAGYLYSVGDDQRGIVVIAHGFGGGGHNSYMDVANFFARNGYYVFAYDATGCDKSEGKGVGGAPQGVIDLDRAISFVEESDAIPDLPIVLFGHSWGGYCVSSVLTFHPEVKAVIECSGFDRSSDMFESGGKSKAGDGIYAMTPFIRLYERIKYGKYATNTAMDGFEASDASVMIVHSADDSVIGVEYGCDKYYEKYKDDDRFTFMRFEDRGHSDILVDQADTYKDEFNAGFNDWAKTLGYDYKASENKDRFIADKAEYITENLDHERWSRRLDEDLFSKFLAFYNEALGVETPTMAETEQGVPDEASPIAGTWATSSIGYEVDGEMQPEYYVQFTATEIVYGHMEDGNFSPEYSDKISSIEETAAGYRVQAESSGGMKYTFQTSESDSEILECYETWDEADFPDMFRAGASLSLVSD